MEKEIEMNHTKINTSKNTCFFASGPMRSTLILLGILFTAAYQGQCVEVVKYNQPYAYITFAPGLEEQAQQLSDYIKKSTKVDIPVMSEPGVIFSMPTQIHIGETEYVKKRKLEFDKLKKDGFIIDSTDKRNIVIVGPTSVGTEFGVYEFIERYLGVRWLLPGPDGEDVPELSTIDIPSEHIVQEPAFFSRFLSGFRGDAQKTWAKRLRMHSSVNFQENLLNVVPPEKYVDTNPEFFPIRNGKRFLPRGVEIHQRGWQPCFTAEGLVEAAAETICEYFAKHPEATSYSLGVNDRSGHCQCDNCRARYPAEKNFIGRTNASDLYYEWCGKVIEKVLEKYPDKYFGCLAYSEVIQAPTKTKVHERMIPYITYDRMQWVKKSLKEKGHQITKDWAKVSPVFGWYDYIYGVLYYLPRVYFHEMGEAYRFGHENNVSAIYAETYPNFTEGPKVYLFLKLTWDPYLDVDELLSDWCVRAVGAEAAEDLAQYYSLWEDYWTRRILKSKWFVDNRQYATFSNIGYTEFVTEEDIRTSRSLLESVVAKAKTGPQKKRAKILLRAFKFTEATIYAYMREKEIAARAVTNKDQAIEIFEAGVGNLELIRKRRNMCFVEFKDHPILHQSIDLNHRHYPKLVGEAWGQSSMFKAFDWANDGVIRAKLDQFARTEKTTGPQRFADVREQAKFMLMMLDDSGKPIFENNSFEKGSDGWSFDVKGNKGSIQRVETLARNGKASLLCKGLDPGTISRRIEVTPGIYGITAYIHRPKPISPDAEVTLKILFENADGKKLNYWPAPDPSVTSKPQADTWTKMAMLGKVPEKIRTEKVKIITLSIAVEGLAEGQKLYIDDVGVYSLE